MVVVVVVGGLLIAVGALSLRQLRVTSTTTMRSPANKTISAITIAVVVVVLAAVVGILILVSRHHSAAYNDGYQYGEQQEQTDNGPPSCDLPASIFRLRPRVFERWRLRIRSPLCASVVVSK